MMFLKTKSIHESSLDRSSLKDNSFHITWDVVTGFFIRQNFSKEEIKDSSRNQGSQNMSLGMYKIIVCTEVL